MEYKINCGFNYFVSHPGGRTYDTFPVNSYEAESRRINRYWDFNHSQGEVTEFEPKISGEANSIFAVEANRKVSSKVGSKNYISMKCQEIKSILTH